MRRVVVVLGQRYLKSHHRMRILCHLLQALTAVYTPAAFAAAEWHARAARVEERAA
jgi:hypothetical protein